MIAVLAQKDDHPAVMEFFELFKTPWEFYRADGNYSVLICTTNTIPVNSAKVVFVYGSIENSFDRAHGTKIRSRRSGSIVSNGSSRIPVYGGCLVFEASGPSVVTHVSTHEPAAVAADSAGQAIVRVGFDLFQEVRHLLTQGQPADRAATPTLELHIALLRSLILGCSVSLIEIPPVPDGHSFIACLTHDMDHIGIRNHKLDHTILGFFYRATVGSVVDVCRGKKNLRQMIINWVAALKLPLVHMGLAGDFWSQPDRYGEIEKEANSTFFVIPKKGEPGLDARGNRQGRRAASYDAAEHLDLLRKLQVAGNEIGLHGIDAWRDCTSGRQEQEIICRLTGVAETGVRMHWLFFNEESPSVLEAAGFSYDSTVGYNQTIGYRAGATQVFKPMNATKLLELPMHVMDTALFYPNYLNLTPGQAQEAIRPLIENAVRFGGALTVNWHDRSVAPERLWDSSYAQLLDELRSAGACFLTAGQAVSWFRKRRATTFERIGDTVKVKIPINDDPRIPGLRVRIYNPDATGEKYSETTSAEGGEIRLAA
ncbi:MAG TPA: hypothetical protein VNV43_10635 [Candidatus Acidoferrales bacterium]|nr:hypothetical protein [Candidatus Acidoferrales bacterium]